MPSDKMRTEDEMDEEFAKLGFGNLLLPKSLIGSGCVAVAKKLPVKKIPGRKECD
jgi:hypothetical protein